MTFRAFHPMHDDQGSLWPELDWRWISATTLARYQGCSHWTVYQRTLAGWYGPLNATTMRKRGVLGGKTCRIYEYCPAALWRAKRWGRYTDPSFNPQAVARRIYECDPAVTAERNTIRQPGELSPEITQLLASQAGALMQALATIRTLSPNLIPAAEPIAFQR